jgi:hypothetical protein
MKNNRNVHEEGAESTKILLRPLRKPSVLWG